jgi:hypothetical protein
MPFPETVEAVATLAGVGGVTPAVAKRRRAAEPPTIDAPAEWQAARAPRRGSQCWRYLTVDRALSATIVDQAVAADVLREGICGTVHAKHIDSSGSVCGWEKRGPRYKGYEKGGRKGAFIFAPLQHLVRRVAITEAFIDALSMAQIEGMPFSTSYVSVDGGFGERSELTLRQLLDRTGPDCRVVVATDANLGGELIGKRIARIADDMGLKWERLLPPGGAVDWNDALRARRPSPPARRPAR